MKELISFLAILLLMMSIQSCKESGEDITEELFYQKTKSNITSKMDSITIPQKEEQEIEPIDNEDDPPPKDGIRWKVNNNLNHTRTITLRN